MYVWYVYEVFLIKVRERVVRIVLGMKWLNEIFGSCYSLVGGKCLMILFWEWYDYIGNGVVLYRKWCYCYIFV